MYSQYSIVPATSPLLHNDNSNSSNEDNDNEEYEKTRSAFHYSKKDCWLFRRRRRRLRMALLSVAVIFLLLLLYIPLLHHIQSRLVVIPGWSFNTSRNISNYIFPGSETTLIQPISVCRGKFFLLVVVCSSLRNFETRQMIRETWGNTTEFNYPLFALMHSHLKGQYLKINDFTVRMYAEYLHMKNASNYVNSIRDTKLPVRIVFILGRSNTGSDELNARLKLESEQFNDIIQENFIDTYNNLTIKSVMMLKWIKRNCLNQAKFLLKCDDDSFINIPNLLHVLLGGTIPVLQATAQIYDRSTINALSPSNRMNYSRNLLMGFLFCSVKPIADIYSKWYSPSYMYNGDFYPHYLSGSSYLMSFDVIPKLFNISLSTQILHLEDIYLTGICAERINLRRKHNPLFSYIHADNKCSYKGTISQHYLKSDLMKDVYNFVINNSISCPPFNGTVKFNRLKQRLKGCH